MHENVDPGLGGEPEQGGVQFGAGSEAALYGEKRTGLTGRQGSAHGQQSLKAPEERGNLSLGSVNSCTDDNFLGTAGWVDPFPLFSH